MWTDYYLTFASQQEFEGCKTALEAVAGAIDDIGTLYRDTGEPCDGYHVNVRLKAGSPFPPSAEPYVIATPALPKRVFMV